MHGRQSEEQQQRRHMLPVPSHGTVGDSSSIKFSSKDGCKISIGDCALFQAGNAPPFIGIIRYLTSDKEGHVKLSVNWLYRPADVKLGKVVLLEAAPNEVFYSFHKDEISAASLLHPCKVAFLRKGIELPSSISSFVCRRFYDTTNRCLWWLTDQDYTYGRLFWRSIVVLNDLRINLRAASDGQSSNLSMMQCKYRTRPKLFGLKDRGFTKRIKLMNIFDISYY